MDMQEKDLQRNQQQDQLRNEQTGGTSRSSDSTYSSNTDGARSGQTSIQGSFQDGTLRQPSAVDNTQQKYGERATTSGVQRIDQNDNKW